MMLLLKPHSMLALSHSGSLVSAGGAFLSEDDELDSVEKQIREQNQEEGALNEAELEDAQEDDGRERKTQRNNFLMTVNNIKNPAKMVYHPRVLVDSQGGFTEVIVRGFVAENDSSIFSRKKQKGVLGVGMHLQIFEIVDPAVKPNETELLRTDNEETIKIGPYLKHKPVVYVRKDRLVGYIEKTKINCGCLPGPNNYKQQPERKLCQKIPNSKTEFVAFSLDQHNLEEEMLAEELARLDIEFLQDCGTSSEDDTDSQTPPDNKLQAILVSSTSASPLTKLSLRKCDKYFINEDSLVLFSGCKFKHLKNKDQKTKSLRISGPGEIYFSEGPLEQAKKRGNILAILLIFFYLFMIIFVIVVIFKLENDDAFLAYDLEGIFTLAVEILEMFI